MEENLVWDMGSDGFTCGHAQSEKPVSHPGEGVQVQLDILDGEERSQDL